MQVFDNEYKIGQDVWLCSGHAELRPSLDTIIAIKKAPRAEKLIYEFTSHFGRYADEIFQTESEAQAECDKQNQQEDKG